MNLLTWSLVFMRASALLAVFPLFSSRLIPARLRVSLGALLAFLIAPAIPLPADAGTTMGSIVGIMVMEIGIGLLLGFVSRMVFFVVEFAGNLIAVQMGLIFSPQTDPFNDTQTQAPGSILFFLAMMILFATDLHHWLLLAFERSYALAPIGGAHLREVLLTEVIRHTARVFSVGLQIAAPIIAVSFIITLMFSVLGRVVPQMNVFGESFAIRTLVGLIVFGLTVTTMAGHIASFISHIPQDVLRVAQFLGAT